MRTNGMPIVVGLVIFLVWEIAATNLWVDPTLLPPASRVFSALASLLSEASFYRHVEATLWLMAKGFVLAFLTGVPIGVLMGVNRSANASMSFYVDFFRTLPAAALIPMFMVLFEGDLARVLVIALSGSLIFAVACRSGVQSFEPERAQILSVLGISPIGRFFKLQMWEMLSELLVGARIAISLSFILATVIEMLLGAHYGLGDLLLSSQPTDKPTMYAVILVLGVIGFALNAVLQILDDALRRMGLLHTH
ncbi:MAG: ABC transporter permease subunit [Methylococcaceae bacterium]|nr:ABC transporter permease subunit [Methylococcaceae bacterium]